MRSALTVRTVNVAVGLLTLCWCFAARPASAQSLDISAPSPVRTNEVTGTIRARDIGDSRLTDHFFAFTGTPGDLLITVESRNLNGDFDVFTATGLRPLLKFTVYDGSSEAITKSIYLRKREDLILRVEARTPNDEDGTYRVRFGGSFEPIIGGSDEGPQLTATEARSVDGLPPAKSGKKGSRVSSVGARIDEPPSEVAAAPTPKAEPAVKPAREATTRRVPSRSSGRRSSPAGRTRPPAKEPATVEKSETTSEAETEIRTAAKSREPEPKAPPTRRRPGRRTATTRPVETPSSPQEPESGPRLIIETAEGTVINRYMTTVRRVTVENGQVVVVGKDGKVERFQLANVVKMSVGP